MDGEAGRGRRRHKTPQWKYFFAGVVVKKYKGTWRTYLGGGGGGSVWLHPVAVPCAWCLVLGKEEVNWGDQPGGVSGSRPRYWLNSGTVGTPPAARKDGLGCDLAGGRGERKGQAGQDSGGAQTAEERNAELCHSHTHWLGRMGRGRRGGVVASQIGITNLGNATLRVLENLGSQGSPAEGTWRPETCSEETSLRPQCLWMTDEREVHGWKRIKPRAATGGLLWGLACGLDWTAAGPTAGPLLDSVGLGRPRAVEASPNAVTRRRGT